MTSNDTPHPGRGPRAGRRRALGRGPGAPATEPPPEEAPSGTGHSPAAAPEGAGPGDPVEARTAGEPGEDTHSGPVPSASPAREDDERHFRGESAPAPAAEPGDPARVPETVEPDADGPGHLGPSDTGTRPERAGAEAEPGPESEEHEALDASGAPAPVPAAAGGSGAAPSQESPEGAPDAPDTADGGVFKVRLANFEGPFDLLLQLISKHKMDVTEVALSKVTDEFMAHIRAMGPDWDLDQTTEFLVVAATLLDLKAARLLPAAEVEDEADLALLEARDLLFARLLQYRAYKQIAEIFNDRLAAEARRYPRTVGLEAHHAELLPEVVISIGPEGFAKLAVKAMQPKPRPQVYVEHIHAPLVSVQEQAGIVVARLKELGEASFRVLVQDTGDTLTVVARFLALLELYREKAVALDQETALGDLLVRWTGGDGETQPVVTDEFDRPPEAPKEEQKA
ncbi:segregation/condensation protein A [Streptomyces coelicoflavus]|uniref:segregation and condensation protein A n=1 Tax=Streptomyces coelicoflavus TaxID=285562 RepID=UPI00142D8F9A|nr:segregation/condensation protein A [Streptomyces coelicoflavus]